MNLKEVGMLGWIWVTVKQPLKYKSGISIPKYYMLILK